MYCIEKMWELVLKGILESMCGEFWLLLLGVINEKVIYFGYYEDLVEKFMGKYNFVMEEIERDLYCFFLEYLVF